MAFRDDELVVFEAEGAPGLPEGGVSGYVAHDGARIWYAAWGEGRTVVLLHGGLGHSGNWGHQVPALVAAGYRVIVVDSRGHGRSTRDDRPYSYALMASDVVAVMDGLGVAKADFVGWSDGACIALVLAMAQPERVGNVLFFACNMDPSGTLPFVATPVIDRCFSRHGKDYAALSETPDDFTPFVEAVSLMMGTQPNATVAELSAIAVPVTVVLGEHDEFIRREHMDYLARTMPGASLVILPEVSHFAPLQRPADFNAMVLAWLVRS